MEDRVLLKRSPRGLQIQLLLYGITALLIGLLATWAFDKLLGWTSGGGSTIKTLTWIGLLLVWAFASLRLWFDWNIKRYEIGKEALVVHAKAGKMGTAQTIYRYESIVSLRMTQGFLGKQFGYGDVRITIPKIEEEVILNDIEDPVRQLAEIQQRMHEKAGDASTSALIN